MPRVVIELQANTQQAVQQIQQFAKAQRDAFDAIRAGNPALADTTIKVSTLTQAYGQLAKATQDFAVQGSPAAASIQTITKAMTDAKGAVIAYGTATAAQKTATSQFLDGLAAGAGKAGTGLAALDKAAKDTAKGGLAALLNDVPIVGGALAKLATHLGGFPLLLGGIVGAGVGFIAFLRSVQVEATKAGAAAAEFAASVENNMRKSIAAIERLRAERGGTRGAREAGPNPALLALERAEAERVAKATRDAALRQAETQAELARGAAPGMAEMLMPGGGMARQERITRDLNKQRLAAEGEYRTELLRIQEQFKTDAVKQEDDYDKKLDDLREDRLKKEKDAAKEAAEATEKQQQLLKETTREGIEFFKTLGPEGAEALKKLEFEQWVLKARENLAQLNAVVAAGKDPLGTYAAAAEVLTKKLDEAVKQGFIPLAKAATEAAVAIDDAADRAKKAAQEWKEILEDYTSAMAALKQRAAQKPAAPTPGVYDPKVGGYVGSSGIYTYPGAAADLAREAYTQAQQLTEIMRSGSEYDFQSWYADQAARLNLNPNPDDPAHQYDYRGAYRAGMGPDVTGHWPSAYKMAGHPNLVIGGIDTRTGLPVYPENYQHGGLVRGVGPVPIIAHGGERILPVHGEPEAGAIQVRIEPGAVQLSGTIIDQQRGWGSLVEELGQALEARLRRRAR
jgi:hypothetical protein